MRHANSEGMARRPDGEMFPYEATAVRVSIGERQVDFVAVRDRTERLRLDAALATLTDLARLHEAVEEVDAVAAEALDIVRRALAADRAAIGVLTPEGRIDWVAAHEMDEFIAAVRDMPSPDQVPWLPRILSSGHAEFVDRTAPEHESSSISALANRMGMAAYAVMPLRAGEEMTGAMGVVWSSAAPPAARDVGLLNTIGRLVGMAIANAGLHETLNARQRALDESESRYRALFEAAPDAIVIEDRTGRVLDANPAAAALYGYPLEGLIGMPATELTTLGPEAVARTIATVRRQGAAITRGVERRADGTTFPSELQFAAVRIGGDERYIVTVRDLTERELFQAELLQAQKMEALGQLVSGVAHELNNPLSAIIAFSQLLRRDPELPADLAHDAELLMQEADRTRRIVQNLLDFARQRPPARQPTSVRSLVDRTAELHAYGLGTANISLEVNIPEDTPPIDVDPSQLQQVVLNLVLNGLEATRASKRQAQALIIRTSVDGKEVVVAVEDAGTGIDMHDLDRLFQPLYTTKAEGLGMGLAIARTIVDGYGGTIAAENRSEGGARLIVELPAASPAAN
jgi:two-component system NtrC family sensor kinase